MKPFETLATYITHPDQHKLFKSQRLMHHWVEAYPMLFDADDLRIAKNQVQLGYHFFEWLAAVLIYHSFGFHSLNQHYQFRKHKSKQQVLLQLTSQDVIQFMVSHPEYGRMNCPDLLLYKPDYSHWLFCEVKGPKDQLRDPHVRFFQELSRISGKRITLVEISHAV